MNLAYWTSVCLSFYIVFINLVASTETTTEQIKSYGNRLRRARAQRQAAPNNKNNNNNNSTEKAKREISSSRQKARRQANDDPIFPPADKSYDFAFRTPEYQRRENSDSLGRVRGLYSFIDDVGEKHLVRYAASADRGFEVFNSVPDASRYVQYSAPLYKTSLKARGRIAYERGPGRQYKFISSGPDQRRTESTGPDGITRGAYSYLDDKNVQRTIQYIAGPGIGYRVVQDTQGTNSHLLPRPALVEFGILYPTSRQPNNNRVDGNEGDAPGTGGFGGGPGGSGFGGGNNGGGLTPVGDDNDFNGPGFNTNDGSGNNGNRPDDDNAIDIDDDGFGGGNPDDFGDDRKGSRPQSGDRTNSDFPRGRGRGGSTIITNSGSSFFGIPPGASARAHVQNIDLKPFGEQGAISPSDALRRDERRSHRLRYYH